MQEEVEIVYVLLRLESEEPEFPVIDESLLISRLILEESEVSLRYVLLV